MITFANSGKMIVIQSTSTMSYSAESAESALTITAASVKRGRRAMTLQSAGTFTRSTCGTWR